LIFFHFYSLLLFKQSARKNGTPKSEVIIPAGNSAGAIIIRANKSDSISMKAPNNILNGMSVREFGPISFLTM